jgi:hypothetical protein
MQTVSRRPSDRAAREGKLGVGCQSRWRASWTFLSICLFSATGLEALASLMLEYRAAYNAAHQIEDATERRRAVALAFRELRYFADRLRNAQVIPPPTELDAVAFGHQATSTLPGSSRVDDRIRTLDSAMGKARRKSRQQAVRDSAWGGILANSVTSPRQALSALPISNILHQVRS